VQVRVDQTWHHDSALRIDAVVIRARGLAIGGSDMGDAVFFDDHNRTGKLAVDLVESLFGKSTLMRD
jgi:hypothetical protein